MSNRISPVARIWVGTICALFCMWILLVAYLIKQDIACPYCHNITQRAQETCDQYGYMRVDHDIYTCKKLGSETSQAAGVYRFGSEYLEPKQ